MTGTWRRSAAPVAAPPAFGGVIRVVAADGRDLARSQARRAARWNAVSGRARTSQAGGVGGGSPGPASRRVAERGIAAGEELGHRRGSPRRQLGSGHGAGRRRRSPRRGPPGAWNEIRRTTPFSMPRRRRAGAPESALRVCYCTRYEQYIARTDDSPGRRRVARGRPRAGGRAARDAAYPPRHARGRDRPAGHDRAAAARARLRASAPGLQPVGDGRAPGHDPAGLLGPGRAAGPRRLARADGRSAGAAARPAAAHGRGHGTRRPRQHAGTGVADRRPRRPRPADLEAVAGTLDLLERVTAEGDRA